MKKVREGDVEEMINKDKPKKELKLEGEADGASPCSSSWLFTDNHSCAVGYESSLLVMFNHTTGKVDWQVNLEIGAITCLQAHELESKIACGSERGDLVIYDYKNK